MKINKQIISWTLYDWANSGYITTVATVFFPLFLKNYWAANISPQKSTFYLGIVNSLVSLFIFIFAPLLGYISDKKKNKKQFLTFFIITGSISSILLSQVNKGQYTLALSIFFISILSFASSLVFYDALLIHITDKKNFDFVSSLGYAIGYLGGGLIFILNITMVIFYNKWGFKDSIEGVKISFISVGIWWIVFSIPMLLFVKEKKVNNNTGFINLNKIFQTIKNISKNKNLLFFIIGYLFYIDAVDTTIKMSMDYGKSLGMKDKGLILAFLMVQFIAIFGTILMNFISKYIGPKKTVQIGLYGYIIIISAAIFMTKTIHFFIIAIIVGLFQGGVQSLSRSIYARLIPENESGEYFGFFNIIGKFAAIIGPFLVGFFSLLSGSNRIGISTVLIIILIGIYFLNKVRI